MTEVDSVAKIIAEMRDYFRGNLAFPRVRIELWADRLTALSAQLPEAVGDGYYRKKPVVIEAFRVQRRVNWPDWFAAAVADNSVVTHGMGKFGEGAVYVEIQTLEGVMRADDGDWIIRGVKGELYPCKPDIFAATYDHAGKPSAPEVTREAVAEVFVCYGPARKEVRLLEAGKKLPDGTKLYTTPEPRHD